MVIAESTTITNPLYGSTLKGFSERNDPVGFLGTVLPNLIGLGLVVGVVVFFFMLLLGALGWISSGGDKTAIESARGKITSALIGLVVLLSTFALLKFIESFFGINILTIDIGPLLIE